MTKFTTTTFLSRSVFVITAFTVLTSVSDSKNWPRSPASSYGNWTRLRKSLLHRNVRAVTEGDIRLVGGHTACQGNVEIYHFGQWGSICDDEWDKREADIVCRLLGYPGADRPTTDSLYGRSRSLIWMDNLYCSGYERRLQDCPFDGWKVHDCKDTEAAGVVCHEGDIPTGASFSRSFHHKIVLQQLPVKLDPRNVLLRLAGGRSPSEGRVEIKVPRNGWGTVCGDGWEILEASVVCKQLGLGFAQAALQNSYFGGQQTRMVLSGVKCIGNENNLASCRHDYVGVVDCPQRDRSIAGVICTKAMPDLIPDNKEIEQSAYLEEKQLMHLQCAMEENCLSSSAYRLRREHREGKKTLKDACELTL
ncbi:lysyl oxidase homolog 2-like [Tachypleus tridentatus]|uniref:lysyl oxidase homolog 2-like n=1 Tax=Tachypleus tridentatus TaxID=6853 RepID=UPI003FD0F877